MLKNQDLIMLLLQQLLSVIIHNGVDSIKLWDNKIVLF
jgi:hypothetical protein